MTDSIPGSARMAVKSKNWTLILGLIMVGLVALIALFGPFFVAQDPLKVNFVTKYQGHYIRPPFPPGAEGYLLGSDEAGRDILSRLLWAVRPTLTLVLVVASLRLVFGILIGLISGWSNSRFARLLDALISGALAIPVLLVALCVIAAFANRWGVWAFILGLLITGWAESARLMQGQTRLIKKQSFIEALRAMGGNSGQIIVSHVIPHVMPLIWIQMAFEASAALLTTATLGFLGYFINAVWVPTDSDWIALRASGMPELGQMLGTSVRNQPWTAVFAGSVVFLIVLAFNLLGDGLRELLNPEGRRRDVEPTQGAGSARSWISERVYFAAGEWRRTAVTGGALVVLLMIIFGGGLILWRAQNNHLETTQITTPGGNQWPSELHDAQGTYWSPARGPGEAKLRWIYIGPGRIVGGPVVDRDGYLYMTTFGHKLVIVGPDGFGRRVIDLLAEPVFGPALTTEGNILVADERGHLCLFTKDGNLLWDYASDHPGKFLSSPIVGPSGFVYLVDERYISAISPAGSRIWQTELPTYSFTMPLPRLSADGKTLFFQEFAIDAETGDALFNQSSGPADTFLVGANSKIYYRTISKFMELQATDSGAVLILQANLDPNMLNVGQRFPFDAGVSPSGNPWLLYTSGVEYFRFVWTEQKGSSLQIIDFPYRVGRFIGIDADGVGYICGGLGKTLDEAEVECRAVQLNNGRVRWKLSLGKQETPIGGALIGGRLYVATGEGKLFALGD